MTDQTSTGRIDLRAIDEPDERDRLERVVGNVLRQVSCEELLEGDLLTRLGSLARPVLAIAALLICCVSALLFWNARDNAGTPAVSLSLWAAAQRMPTNGELLAVFEGYAK